MQLEIKKYLFDIQSSIDSINEYLAGKRDFYIYQNNKLLRRGIERELEIIGKLQTGYLKLILPSKLTMPAKSLI
jgi:uncharacterized protein with HEPN domain